MNADERGSSDERRPTDRSGFNPDLCGDGIERRMVLIPTPGGIEPCPLKVDGDCPSNCDACVAFAEEIKDQPSTIKFQ